MSEPAGELYTGGTYAGSPVGCLVGIKLLEIMERDKVLDNVIELERVAKQKFGAMATKYEIVGDVRVMGAYLCVEFVEDKDSKAPAHDLWREVVYAMERRGRRPDLRAGVQLVPAHAGAQHAAGAVRARLRPRRRGRGRGQHRARQGHRLETPGRARPREEAQPMTYDSLPFSGIATFFKAPLLPAPTAADADVAVVGIGWDEGTTSRSGARMGPRALREASTMYAFQRDAEPFWDGEAGVELLGGIRWADTATSRSVRCGRPSATTTPSSTGCSRS